GPLGTAAAALMAALPAILCWLYVRAYGVDVPFWDEWSMVSLLDRLEAGRLSFADLFRPHNEHRIFFPRLVILGLARLTGYDTRAAMYAGWLAQCASAVILLLLFARGERSWRGALFKFIPASCLMFSLRQTDNLLWGFQLGIFLPLLFFLLAAFWLGRSERPDWRYALALASGVGASFSLTNGLLIWPLGLFQLLCRRGVSWRRPGRALAWRVGVWALAGVAAFWLYFRNYTPPPGYPPLFSSLQRPAQSVKYFMAYLANPLTGDMYPAIATGGLLLAVYVIVAAVWLRRGPTGETAALLSVALWTLASGAMLVVVRSGLGVTQALSSRYVTFTAAGLSAVYLLILRLEPGRWRAGLTGFALALIAGGVLTAYPMGILTARATRAERKASVTYLRSYRVQNEKNLSLLYPDARYVMEHAPTLERHRWSVFRDLAPGEFATRLVPEETLFGAEVDGRGLEPASPPVRVSLAGAEALQVTGWAIDHPARTTAGGVFVILDGRTEIPTSYQHPRGDVAEAFGDVRYLFSGFAANLPAAMLWPGPHKLSLKIVRNDGREYFQPRREFVFEVE
ncbi:MAG TPA: hypothetical protein VFC61_08075, partial [Blastocatellia bacterium]|nr:hypothetical protein [Blastocatellia bacterium]